MKKKPSYNLGYIAKDRKSIDNILHMIRITDYPKEKLLPNLNIKFQDGAIKENGENGVQFTALIEIALEILKKLNYNFPCKENAITITKLKEALIWQETRTKEREKRGVEGLSKK
jgi:hypothetical protein